MSKNLLEEIMIVPGFRPVDLSAGANAGDYVSLDEYESIVVVFHSAIGTAGDDPTLTIQQAQDNAGTGVKALNFTELWVKQAATNLLAVAQWTKVTQAAANTYTSAVSAEQEALWAVPFHVSDLDRENGFTHIIASVADVGTNAQLGALYYILGHPRTKTVPASMAGAIA